MTDTPKFASGQRVVLDDGRHGTLENPRGCFCGPNGEACWDIGLLGEAGGVQAHGGTFRLSSDPDLCMCNHLGPDGKGYHTGPVWCEPLTRKTCVHPDCLAKKFGPCKGFANLQQTAGFLTDERLGGP